jgi:hypothetical protein
MTSKKRDRRVVWVVEERDADGGPWDAVEIYLARSTALAAACWLRGDGAYGRIRVVPYRPAPERAK